MENKNDVMLLVSIYDRVAMCYSEPKMFYNEPCAVRWFNGVMTDTKLPPDDFELHGVGTFDISRGVVTPFEKPQFIQQGLNGGVK